jgi:hypothetical protein
MVRIWLRRLPIFLLAVLCSQGLVFADDIEFMSVSELEELLTKKEYVPAVFYSVPQGTDLKLYTINIQGVLRTPSIDVILFTTSSQIESGMSGSPVYVDDKLVGALAYKLNGTPIVSWGGISPIHYMKSEADALANGDRLNANMGFSYKGMSFVPIPLAEVMSISGQVSNNSKMPLSYGYQLKAGMPIVVDLASWSDELGRERYMGSMGTVTYIDDKRVYAFGHPFLNLKTVRYAFRTAEVLGTISGQNKIAGRLSEVIGVIDTDSGYGIYGDLSLAKLDELHNFNLEFRLDGVRYHNFAIRLSDSIQTPVIAASVFSGIGQSYGAPLDHEAIITQIDATFEIANQQSIHWATLFSPQSVQFGVNTLYLSSFRAATNTLLSNIFSPLFTNNYDFDIEKVNIITNFVPGNASVLKASSYDFPDKIVWGENPVLRLMLVADDNSLAIEKYTEIVIDWDEVRVPVYSNDVKDSDKDNQKRVRGVVVIYGGGQYENVRLYLGEPNVLNPSYYFGPEDYLDHLARRLAITNRSLFGKISLSAKEIDERESSSSDVNVDVDGNATTSTAWNLIADGLKVREVPRNRSGNVVDDIEFPEIPNGYVILSNLRINHVFEIVLDNKEPDVH